MAASFIFPVHLLLLGLLILLPAVCDGAKAGVTPLPMVSPPIKRRSRSLAPIQFKGAFKGTSRTPGVSYTYFDGKFRGVQLYKYIEAHLTVDAHGRINMLGFVGKFTSKFAAKYINMRFRVTMQGSGSTIFDGYLWGQRMAIDIKQDVVKARFFNGGKYIKASESGSFTAISKSNNNNTTVAGTYSMRWDGDKVWMKMKTQGKKMKGKKRRRHKGAVFEFSIKMPQLMKMLNGEVDGYWTMYYGGQMKKGSLKQMMMP